MANKKLLVQRECSPSQETFNGSRGYYENCTPYYEKANETPGDYPRKLDARSSMCSGLVGLW